MIKATSDKQTSNRILVWLFALIVALLVLPKVDRFVTSIPIHQLINQLLAYPMPEKTEVFATSFSGVEASLIISSDLPFNEIRSYYRSMIFKPVFFGKHEDINLYVDEWDLDAVLYFLGELNAKRFVTEAKYQHYYTILLSYQEYGDSSGSVKTN